LFVFGGKDKTELIKVDYLDGVSKVSSWYALKPYSGVHEQDSPIDLLKDSDFILDKTHSSD